MGWRSIAESPWYPVVFGIAYVLNSWIHSGVSLLAEGRALVIVTLAVTVAILLLFLLTRRLHLAAAIVLVAFAGAMARGTADVLAVVVLALAVPCVIYLLAKVRQTAVSWRRTTRALNGLSAVILAVVLAGGIPRGTYAALAGDLRQGTGSLPDAGSTDGEGRDVVVLLLDGYPRADTVGRLFGGDISAFVNELDERGFDVLARNESNYPYTQATLTSMFHMRPLADIDELREVEDGSIPPYPTMRGVLNENPVFGFFRDQGYITVAYSPGFEHVTLRQADVFVEDASLNEAERHLIRGTFVQTLIDLFLPHALAGQYADRIRAGFDAFEDVARHLDRGSLLAFVHVPSPHMPVVLTATGGVLPDPPGEQGFRTDPPASSAVDAYLGQIEYLNRRTLEAIDVALTWPPDREPIIVVMSDHGAPLPPLDGDPWPADRYANFMAIRVPAGVELDVPDRLSPINLFGLLSSSMFGVEAELWADRHYPWRNIGE